MAGAPHGGAEAFFERLVIALHKAGLEQRVLIRRDAERAARLEAAGLHPVEAPFGGAFDFATPALFKREIAAFRPDIVLTWMNRATKFCPQGRFVHAARLGGYYDLKYYGACDELIGNTEDIVRYLTKAGWPEPRAHYVPNFTAARDAAPEPRAAHATPEDVPLVLAMGRLHTNKAFDTLLKAWALVPTAHLWLAGQGPEEARLKALAGELGVGTRVHFLGWRDDIAPLFAACDLFVCPSRHEPLGNVVLDAFAHNRAVVATRSQGPAMLIEHERTGLLVPIDDPEALAPAIFRLIAEPQTRARFAAAGHAEWREKFSEPVVVAQYLALFERLASAKQVKHKDHKERTEGTKHAN
ncbi:MAG: glycosyltransferase [Alphaproteobacteria bacterium]